MSRSETKTKRSRSERQREFKGVKKVSRVFDPARRTTVASRQRRPVAINESMHVILKSDFARGKMNLLRHKARIAKLVDKLARSHGVRVYKIANVGNHIHISLKVTKRLLWKPFITGLTGGIARAVGFVKSDDRGFWSARPFSRLVSWGREFKMIADYITLNEMEADGVLPPRSQRRKDADWRRLVALIRDA